MGFAAKKSFGNPLFFDQKKETLPRPTLESSAQFCNEQDPKRENPNNSKPSRRHSTAFQAADHIASPLCHERTRALKSASPCGGGSEVLEAPVLPAIRLISSGPISPRGFSNYRYDFPIENGCEMLVPMVLPRPDPPIAFRTFPPLTHTHP